MNDSAAKRGPSEQNNLLLREVFLPTLQKGQKILSKFEQLTSFMSVADQQSFAKAARKLGVSTAAISKQIAVLEQTLGVELFHRSTRRVTLSELGKIYLEQIRPLLRELHDADSFIKGTLEKPQGHLAISAGRYFAERFIVPFLHEFNEHFPTITVNLELAERLPDLEREPIDIIIGMSIPGPPEALQRVIGKTRYVLVASPAYLKKYGTPKHPDDLKHHRYIAHSMRVPDNSISFKNNKQVLVEPSLWLNDSHAMRSCSLQGMGIAKLHEYVVKEDILAKRLQEVLADDNQSELSLYLCYQARRYAQPKIRAFIDFIVGKMKELNG